MNARYFALKNQDAHNRPFVPLISPFSSRAAAVIGRKTAQNLTWFIYNNPETYQNHPYIEL